MRDTFVKTLCSICETNKDIELITLSDDVRKDPVARKHGHIQLAIFVFYIALIAVLYATGNIPADAISQYKQILSGNFTRI